MLRKGCLFGGCHIGTVPSVGTADAELVDRAETVKLAGIVSGVVLLIKVVLETTGCLVGGCHTGIVFVFGIDADEVDRIKLVLTTMDPVTVPLVEVTLDATDCLFRVCHIVDTAAGITTNVGFGTRVLPGPLEADIAKEKDEL